MLKRSIIIVILMICGHLFAHDTYTAQSSVDTANAVTYIRGIEIYGNKKTREDVLKRFFTFEINEPLDTSKIRTTKENLLRTRLFDKVDVFPFIREDGTHIFVMLKESVRLQLGYDVDYYTRQYGLENLWFRFGVDVTIENFRGRMEELSVGVNAWDHKVLDLGWYKPFPPTPYYISLSAGGSNYPDFILPIDYIDVFARITAGRRLGNHSRTWISAIPIYRYRTIVDLPHESAASAQIPDDLRHEFYEAFAAVGFATDYRDALFDPKRGSFFSTQLRTNSLYNGVNIRFFQQTSEFRHYIPLLFGDMAALRLQMTLRNKNAGAYHRLTYGGSGEIRGYGDDELGWNFIANSSFLASIKYHKRLYKTPQAPVPLVGSVFSGVNKLHLRFDATLIADYARLYGDPQGALTFSGPQQDGAGLGFGVRILAPEIRQSGCIDLVFGKKDNVDGNYTWEPTLHIYLDLFY